MARQGRSFNEYLAAYKEKASEAELSVYEAAHAQFTLVNELIERRKAEGLTQLELAEASGIGQPEISRIERGLANPTTETLNRIARVLRARVGLVDNPPVRH